MGDFFPPKLHDLKTTCVRPKKSHREKGGSGDLQNPSEAKHGSDGLVSIVLLTRQVLRLIDRWGCPMALTRVLILLQVVGSAQQPCTTSWGCPADGSDGVTVIQ